jgi:hypothetical protein
MATLTSKLHGKPDGSFLVCGSQKEEKYTLCVRKGEANEIIHICRSKKKYGFFDTLKNKPVLMKFPTIPALVEHFRRVPLTKYNPRLNINLAYPISRFAEVSERLIMGYCTKTFCPQDGAVGGGDSVQAPLENQKWYWGDISRYVLVTAQHGTVTRSTQGVTKMRCELGSHANLPFPCTAANSVVNY